MANLDVYLLSHQWIIFVVLLWDIPWKLITLWQSAQRKQKAWFISLFLFNTLGLLPIIYLLTHRSQPKN